MATMDPAPQRSYRGSRTNGHVEGVTSGRRALHGNKRWLADGVTGRSGATTPHLGGDGERWERDAHRGGGRGRGQGGRTKFGNLPVNFRRNGALDGGPTGSEEEHSEVEDERDVDEPDANELGTPEERENFWQELVKAREAERKKAIAEGKMDDPSIPKRLEDAITMVGTCLDMCPRFERYRRERENNLFEWEMVPGTKRVDHKRAVKAYERAAGDKTLPSDLRPPDVLKRTLDYLFHDLLPHGGFSETFNFIRDRSRAVRNDFTMQHDMGPIAIECHDRCARFHILALHIERDHPQFSITMEEQQLMNTLQSLKEFHQDQRGLYQSPTELEMRVYHRLVHIRDQKERHDDIPQALLSHPVFELTTKFRTRVQIKSAPITKTSPLVVDVEAMHIFAELANVLRREGNVVMTYLVACILERHFGKDTIEDIESIRGDLSLSNVIDGYSGVGTQEQDTDVDISVVDETETRAEHHSPHAFPKPLQPSGTQWLTDTFGPKPTQSAFFKSDTADSHSQPHVAPASSAFSNLKTIPNAFGITSFGTNTQSAFTTAFTTPPTSAFSGTNNSAPASGSSLKSTDVPGGPVGLSTSYATSSFPPISLEATTVQATPPEPQSGRTAALYPLLPQHSQTNGFSFIATKRTVLGTEASTSTLSPFASTFTPASNVTSAIITNASAPSATPSVNVHPSNEKRKTSDFSSIPIDSPSSMPPHPTQEQSISDTVAASEIPFVSSPPSMGSPPLDSTRGTPPSQPPPLGRRQPISLPPTPTATLFIPASFPEKRKSIFGSLKNIQTTSHSALPSEILSPLVLHSPTPRSSLIPGPPRRESFQSPLKAVVSAADIEAESEPPVEKLDTSQVSQPPPPMKKPSLDIMKATALHFARRGWLVKQAFSKWRQRLSDHARWIEACRRSALYKEKAQAERLSRSESGCALANSRTHRRTPSEARTPLKKRLRERLSGEYRPPANDEELVKRFEKNHEDHARRWARGSFLTLLRKFLESSRSPFPRDWCAWLSLNQETDGTAIWLEQKFNVPDSGEWRNENVFQVPISNDHLEVARSYPGVIIFERTPLTDVADILGRKYRVLEDCTRLREVIEAFPMDQHYVPSLLCIAWSERDPDSSKDFDDMVASMVEEGVLTSTQEFVISTATLDVEAKLDEVLHAIPFDLEGRLVKNVTLNDLFDIWNHQWEETATRWLVNCTVYGEFNWDLYAKLLESCICLLIQMIDAVITLLRDDDVTSDIPHLPSAKGMDSDKMYSAVLDWLRGLPATHFASLLTNDIKAHQELGRDFPTMTFLSQLYALARPVVAHILDVDPEVARPLSRSRLDGVSQAMQTLKRSLEEELKVCHFAKLKPSKRVASFAEPSTDPSRTSTPRSKKPRVSLSDGFATDEETPSLSPSSASVSTTTSVPSEPDHHMIVTPAMLRSLTKDIRAKYGAS